MIPLKLTQEKLAIMHEARVAEAKEFEFLAEVERRAGASREEMLKASKRWPFSAQALLRRILGAPK